MAILSVLLLFTLLIARSVSENNFGPYKLSWQHIEACKGPKREDCGKFGIENIENPTDLIFRLDFPKDCPVTAAKVVISSKQKDNSMKKLWNYALNKPCQHFVLGPILMESFNLTNSCQINKGNYSVHLNYSEKSTMFLGSSFFYGTYSFKVMSFNKAKNFFCVHSTVEIQRI